MVRRRPGRHRRSAAVSMVGACLAVALAGGGRCLGASPPADRSAAPEGSGTGFAEVVPGRELTFPRDLGAHPAYRTEWWYVTGWLQDEGGVERGFQVTFFRVRSRLGEGNPSRFAPRQLIFAHAAIADPAHGRLMHDQRAARATAPLAGAAPGKTEVWVGDWSLRWSGRGYRARVVGEGFALDLDLTPQDGPMLNGEEGFSRKDADPRHASYYYSRPQLRASGELGLAGRSRRVEGRAWLDHEWSSELMPAGARGWDWIGINLADGGALMAFRMRGASGDALWAAGSLRTADGATRALGPREVRFSPQRRWRSPRTGIEYPVEWTVELAGEGGPRRLRLLPLMDDQELDSRPSTGAIYWEGAVRAVEDGREIGRGYLEMTGYGGRPPL